MPRQKPRKKLEEELRRLRASQLYTLIGSLLNSLIWAGSAVAIAYFITDMVKELAGQMTHATVGLKLFADIKLDQAIAYILAGGGTGYGVLQRQLRRHKVEYLAHRNTELERQIDPKRSSSKLTPRGGTRPEDRL